MRKLFYPFFFFLLIGQLLAQSSQSFVEQALFLNGNENYNCYRIPAIIKAPNGDLLAFAEGRIKGCNDFGDVDIVLKTSKDNGQSWSPLKVVANNGNLQAGNPAPLVDYLDPQFPNGRIFLLYNTGIKDEGLTREGKGLREVWYITSTDNGQNWSAPNNITLSVHRPNRPDLNPKYNFKADWRSYANTPGHALQINKGKYKGRLFIPANHSAGTPLKHFDDYRAHAFYSDDHGKTWKISENVDLPSSNESIAATLSNGQIVQNIRHQNGQSKNRIIALSSDGGTTWDTSFFEQQLPDPVCQASLINYKTPKRKEVLLFSNPNSQTKREKMTVRVSYDDGQNWLIKRQIRSGPSAYSDLVIQENDHIGLLYEHGNDGGIYYAHFNYEWLISDTEALNPWVKKEQTVNDFTFKLAEPLLHFDQSLFTDQTKVKMQLDLVGTQIYYTTDGTIPSEKSNLYQQEISIDKTCKLQAIAFHKDCQSSHIASADFVKVNQKLPVKKATLSAAPHEKYPGLGAMALFDLKKGTSNFQEDHWMGFNGDDIEVWLELEQKQSFSEITISLLSDMGSWIFPPGGFEVFVSKDNKKFTSIYQKTYPLATEEKSELLFLSHQFKTQKSKYIKIVIKNIPAIPDWHPGAGTPAWLFIDEIILN